jgi:ergothioneine biosynthesis glutamate--cysteine ligase EgtA
MAVRTVPILSVDAVRERLTQTALTDGDGGRVGLELEAHVIDAGDPARDVPWSTVLAATEGPPLPAGSSITLEPGGQVELSTACFDDVAQAVGALRRDQAALAGRLDAAGLAAAPIGTDPLRPPRLRNPGSRYASMRAGFSAAGYAEPAAAMMCSSASLQLNLDAGPREGWARRVTTVHALGPVLTAISACSPWLHGRDTGWCSARMRAWQQLDPARTAPYPGRGEPAEAWAAFALAAPVLAVVEDAGIAAVTSPTRVPLVDWLSGDVDVAGRRPTEADLALHLTMLWPPLRLRGFLEIRSMDAVPAAWWPGLAALVVGMVDGAPEACLQACAAVATRWETAARDGLCDPALLAAARDCVAAALPTVPAGLRAEATAYAELVAAGRTPGDLLAEDLADCGPAAALLGATR